MDAVSFDALTRRASLAALGTAGLAAVAGPLATSAKQKKKGDVNKKCKQQVAPCTSIITNACELSPAQCAAAASCCSSFGKCDPIGFFNCLTLATSP